MFVNGEPDSVYLRAWEMFALLKYNQASGALKAKRGKFAWRGFCSKKVLSQLPKSKWIMIDFTVDECSGKHWKQFVCNGSVQGVYAVNRVEASRVTEAQWKYFAWILSGGS